MSDLVEELQQRMERLPNDCIEYRLFKRCIAALSAAEQRAEGMRKDFERQLSVRMPDPRSSDLICPVCHERDFDAEGLAMHFTHYRCNGAALASVAVDSSERGR